MSPWGNGPLRAIYRFKWHERIDFDRISPNCCDPVRWHAGLKMDIRRISFTREWSETVTTRFWFTSHFLPDSRPLDCAATFNLAVSTEINYTAFQPTISDHWVTIGNQWPLADRNSPSPSSNYRKYPTDTPLYLPPRSPEPYPSKGIVTHTRATEWAHRHNEPLSWIFN